MASLTLDQLLAQAQLVLEPRVRWEDRAEPMRLLARGVLDLLGESQPCTFEPPCIEDRGTVAIMAGSEDPQPAYEFTTAEARAWCAMVLRAADERDRLDAAEVTRG